MLGAEAIWWLNSALLALLTHAGLLWMLVVVEPREIDKPVETTIIIESLPDPVDVTEPLEQDKTEPVRDRVMPAKVQEAEAANAPKSKDENTTTPIADNEPLAVVEPADEALEITSSEPTKQPASDGEVALTTEVERTQPTSPEQKSALIRTSETAEKPAKTQTPTTDRVQEANRNSGIAKDVRAKLLRPDRNRETVKTFPEANERLENSKPVISQKVVAPTSVQERPTVGEQVAVLAPKVEAVPGTEVIKSEETQPQETFVFPKDAQRLGSTPAKPSQPVESPRVSAVETATSPNSRTDQPRERPSAERVEQVAVAAPNKAGRVEPDGRYRELLKFLKDSEVTGCASVLPTIASNGSVFLSGFAADEALWETFQKSMAEELRIQLPLEVATVAKPQCRALTFARTLSNYPVFSLGMKLENTDLVSGEFLNGAITDVRDRKVHLLVVDDEGLVQQADPLLQPKVSGLTFSIQMYVSGKAVRTAQMMIALAVEKPLNTVTTANQTMAEDFFAAVSEELAETKQTTDIAIVSFYLRSAEEQ